MFRASRIAAGATLVVLSLILVACTNTSDETTPSTTTAPQVEDVSSDSGSGSVDDGEGQALGEVSTTTTLPAPTTTASTTTTTEPPTTTTRAPASTTTTTAATTTTTSPGNATPTIAIDSPVNGSQWIATFNGFGFTADVPLRATVSDPDGETPQVVWSWTGMSSGFAAGASATATLEPGTYTVTATATDAAGASASQSVSILVWIPSDD